MDAKDSIIWQAKRAHTLSHGPVVVVRITRHSVEESQGHQCQDHKRASHGNRQPAPASGQRHQPHGDQRQVCGQGKQQQALAAGRVEGQGKIDSESTDQGDAEHNQRESNARLGGGIPAAICTALAVRASPPEHKTKSQQQNDRR